MEALAKVAHNRKNRKSRFQYPKEENEEPSRKITALKCCDIKTALVGLPQLTVRLYEAGSYAPFS
jgi:hypothetical protein